MLLHRKRRLNALIHLQETGHQLPDRRFAAPGRVPGRHVTDDVSEHGGVNRLELRSWGRLERGDAYDRGEAGGERVPAGGRDRVDCGDNL